MHDIIFNAHYGDEIKDVRLSFDGQGSGCWMVYIDNYYRGRLEKQSGVWVSVDKTFDLEDVAAMGERIDRK